MKKDGFIFFEIFLFFKTHRAKAHSTYCVKTPALRPGLNKPNDKFEVFKARIAA